MSQFYLHACVAQWQSNALVMRRSGVQLPSQAFLRKKDFAEKFNFTERL